MEDEGSLHQGTVVSARRSPGLAERPIVLMSLLLGLPMVGMVIFGTGLLVAQYLRFPKHSEGLRLWFERKYEKPAREALSKLIERASQSTQETLKRMAGTLTRWFEPIVHYIWRGYSNGITEGLNNKIKLIQRMAYGLRNAHNRQNT